MGAEASTRIDGVIMDNPPQKPVLLLRATREVFIHPLRSVEEMQLRELDEVLARTKVMMPDQIKDSIETVVRAEESSDED